MKVYSCFLGPLFRSQKKKRMRFFSHLTPRIHIFTKIHYISIHCPPSRPGSRDPCKWGYENLCLNPPWVQETPKTKYNQEQPENGLQNPEIPPNQHQKKCCVQLNAPNKKQQKNNKQHSSPTSMKFLPSFHARQVDSSSTCLD